MHFRRVDGNRTVQRIVSRKIMLPVIYNELLCESEQLERHEITMS